MSQILSSMSKPTWPKLLLVAALASTGVYFCHAQRNGSQGQDEVPIKDSAAFLASLKIDSNTLKRDEPLKKSYAAILDKVEPAVVKIVTYQTVREGGGIFYDRYRNQYFREKLSQRDVGNGLGSGVIVSKDGYVITNNHVIEQASKIKVQVPGRDEPLDAVVVNTDRRQDVAVIKIKAENLPVATLADSSQVTRGDIVFAVGAPFGYEQSASMGIISSVGERNVSVIGDGKETLIQTDAAVNPGNSGGPLVDAEGRVVGINTAIHSQSGGSVGIGFAIPINRVIREAAKLAAGEVRPQSGYLGIETETMTDKIANILTPPQSEGALVVKVHPESPAALAGLKEEDVLLELQGRKVSSKGQLEEEIDNLPPGREIQLAIWRDNNRIDLKIKLGDYASAGVKPPDSGVASRYGLKLTELTDELREKLGYGELVQGVLIADVLPGSSAEQYQLQEGDLITRINRTNIRSAQKAEEALEASIKNGAAMVVFYRGGQQGRVILEVR
jgi:serine protease Do